jgi:hypothetical protein
MHSWPSYRPWNDGLARDNCPRWIIIELPPDAMQSSTVLGGIGTSRRYEHGVVLRTDCPASANNSRGRLRIMRRVDSP